MNPDAKMLNKKHSVFFWNYIGVCGEFNWEKPSLKFN